MIPDDALSRPAAVAVARLLNGLFFLGVSAADGSFVVAHSQAALRTEQRQSGVRPRGILAPSLFGIAHPGVAVDLTRTTVVPSAAS